ncbi:MAG: right-handed parallel beta-helix repeat-containing protein [Planctomycetota bacterium]
MTDRFCGWTGGSIVGGRATGFGLLLLAAYALCVATSAQTLTGSATVEVDAAALIERIDAQDARLDEAERERDALRLAVESLAQAAPGPVPTSSTDTTKPKLTPNDPAAPLAVATGFTVFAPSPDGRTVYVSAEGNDRNHGFTPDAPVRTARAGYQKLRDGRPDRLLFRAGDQFEGNLGALKKSGRSAAQPMVIGVYENAELPNAPRPVLLSPGGTWAKNDFRDTADHVVFVGLHFVAVNRDPNRPGFNAAALTSDQWNASAITYLGDAQNITVEDCKFEYFKFAMVFQSNPQDGFATDIKLHRNLVLNSYGHWDKKVAGHSSGIYAAYVDGLTITDNLWDHNGWHPDVPGAKRTKFNHNLYLQDNCTFATDVRGNLITRASAHGLQLRSGGNIIDNLFIQNPLGFFTGKFPSVVKDNVVLQSIDMGSGDSEARGHGIEILPCLKATVENNILSQKQGTLPNAYAIQFSWEKNYVEWLNGRAATGTLKNNKVYRWPRRGGGETVAVKFGQIEQAGNVIDGDFPDPDRDVASYLVTLGVPAEAASLESFLDTARARPRGVWWPAYSATAVNDYIREGFE